MTNPPRGSSSDLPKWVKPQLCKLADAPPQGPEWLHEIKYDGYRMHARLDRGRVSLLTRTGLDWTQKYPSIAATLSALPVNRAYLDGELCGVTPDGKTSFSSIQTASDSGNAAALVFYLFDLLYLDGKAISAAPLPARKARKPARQSWTPAGMGHCRASGEAVCSDQRLAGYQLRRPRRGKTLDYVTTPHPDPVWAAPSRSCPR